MRALVLLASLGAGLVVGLAGPALAQSGTCRPPLKWAAGACVIACPGGYEDRGRECVLRSQGR